MTPFNLELAKAGKPLITRDGRVAKFIAHVPEAKGEYRVVALVALKIMTTTEGGAEYQDSTSHGDLFMGPNTKKVWVNLYPTSWMQHMTEEEADNGATPDRIHAAFEIEVAA